MASGNSRERRKANISWLSASIAFVAMMVYGAYGSDALRDANGDRPPWPALAIAGLVAMVALRRYFLGPLDPEGTPSLRRRMAARALPLAACVAAALSALLAGKAVYLIYATSGIDARNDWRIAEAILFAALAMLGWRRWKRRSR